MKTIFQGNTGEQTLLEKHFLKVIAPEPTNAYMDVIVVYDDEKKQYRTHYILNDISVGMWIATIKNKNVERKYLPYLGTL